MGKYKEVSLAIKGTTETLFSDAELFRLKQEGGGYCYYCGKENANTVDHIIPKSRGGSDDASNLVLCCSRCNQLKGDKDILEFIKFILTYSIRKI